MGGASRQQYSTHYTSLDGHIQVLLQNNAASSASIRLEIDLVLITLESSVLLRFPAERK